MRKKRLVPTGLNPILLAFLGGDRTARKVLPLELEPLLLRVVQRRLATWPTDLHYEVINELWVSLLSARPGQFDPARGEAMTFIWYHLRTAIRRVRADNCAPGVRTRDAEAAHGVPQPDVVSLSEPPAAMRTVFSTASTAAVEAQCDARTILAAAPGVLGEVLISLYVDDVPVEEVARDVGMSRFTVRRQIKKFCAAIQRAA